MQAAERETQSLLQYLRQRAYGFTLILIDTIMLLTKD